MADNTTEQSVEQALAELREMFPAEDWFEARETRRYTLGRNGGFAEVVVGYESFRAETLKDAMDQVRAWHAEQAKES